MRTLSKFLEKLSGHLREGFRTADITAGPALLHEYALKILPPPGPAEAYDDVPALLDAFDAFLCGCGLGGCSCGSGLTSSSNLLGFDCQPLMPLSFVPLYALNANPKVGVDLGVLKL